MTRTRNLLALLSVLSMPALLGACAGGEIVTGEATSGLDQHFQAAGAEFRVPAELLKAISYVQTNWYNVPGDVGEVDEQPTWGPMALRGEALTRAATLAGMPVEVVQQDPAANIRAAAALFSADADELKIDRANLGAWAKVIAKYNSPDGESQAYYIHEEVYRVLREGLKIEGERVVLSASPDVTPDFPLPPEGWSSGDRGTNAGSSLATWLPAPSSNYTVGRSYGISLVVIHTCAGGYSGCVGWLRTPYPQNPYKTSAHYVVNESGSQVAQLVDEKNTAHHVGKSWQGLPTNSRSIGIEHGGFSYAGSNAWSAGQMSKSIALTCDIVKRYGIARDRNHIIGHYQPDPVNRANDPGTAFPWADYMARVNSCVGGGGGGGTPPPSSTTITIDSNQANNASNAKIDTASASSAWVSSANVSGYYGSGYWTAKSAAVSDGMPFKFYLPSAQQKTVYAWWTAASDRSPATPFVVLNASGAKLGSVTKDQRANGARWNAIGTYNFSAGWNTVIVSRWASSPGQVVADAIQVR